MEIPNVNNLNGIPNFGHGLKGSQENPFTETEARELMGDEEVDKIKKEVEELSIDEVVEVPEDEDKPKKKKK